MSQKYNFLPEKTNPCADSQCTGWQIKAKSEKMGRFLEEITPSLVIGQSNGAEALTAVETLRQCYALAVADIDTVRRCAVGTSSRKIVELVGLGGGRSVCLRNAGALQCQSKHGGGV